MNHYLRAIKKNPLAVTKEDFRSFLLSVKQSYAPTTYKNILSSLKRYYRDYLEIKELFDSFKFPQIAFKPISVPTKREPQDFYFALETPRSRTLFLFYASSGLRKSEVLNLNRFKNIEYKKNDNPK
ncbi:hypothetical protein KJN74_05545 [Candidatus Bathyarchaeota archaeon]|nr:hypothetical protein [Candidatus Bathyarchaeota archaeon]